MEGVTFFVEGGLRGALALCVFVRFPHVNPRPTTPYIILRGDYAPTGAGHDPLGRLTWQRGGVLEFYQAPVYMVLVYVCLPTFVAAPVFT